LNPDQAAMINHYKMYYASNAPPEPQSTLAGGQLFYQFEHIDYPFEAPPNSIETDQTSGTVEKQVLAVFNGSRVAPDVLLPALADRLGHDAVKHVAERHLLLEPDRSVYLDALQQLTTWNELADFLRAGLARRPISIPWHRAYQSTMMQIGKDDELEQDYTQMLAGDPQNANLIYLAGRVTRDMDRRMALLELAANANPPSPYAFYSLCVHYLANAQFPEAAENGKKAVALIKNDAQVRRYCVAAFNAAGDFQESLNIILPEELGEMPQSLEAYVEEMYVYLLQNQPSQAADAIARLRDFSNKTTPQYEAENVASTEAIRAYVMGNPDEYVSKLKDVTDTDLLFSAAITAGDVKTAVERAGKVNEDAHTEALLYLCALQHGDTKVADERFKQMVDRLSAGNYENRAYGAAIQGQSKIPLAQLMRLYLPPKQKAAMLIVLGLKDPAAREQCFAMAGKLNFDKRFPHLLFKSLLDAPPVH
jgi:hypothetical protein